MKNYHKNIIILASGNGTNAINIINHFSNKNTLSDSDLFNISIKALVCNNLDAPVINKVKNINNDIKLCCIPFNKTAERILFEEELSGIVDEYKIDYIILAGFMKILSDDFVLKNLNKIINIHPSLLPAFKGKNAIKDAFDYGVKVTGVTVHFVIPAIDSGPIILQEPVFIEESDTVEFLEEKIHKLEHKIYIKALEIVLLEKIKIVDNKVKIFE
jgi:phosphoribosylglycinamide formyltransferase-1